MGAVTFLSDRSDTMSGWSRRVMVADTEYSVSVRRGKAVRIPYKPRHQNRGWQWHGAVYEAGRCIWSGRVPGSIGCRGLLLEAGVLCCEEAMR